MAESWWPSRSDPHWKSKVRLELRLTTKRNQIWNHHEARFMNWKCWQDQLLNVECRIWNVEGQATDKGRETKMNSIMKSKMNSERIESSSNRLGRSASPLCYEFSQRSDDISYDDLRWCLRWYLMNVSWQVTMFNIWHLIFNIWYWLSPSLNIQQHCNDLFAEWCSQHDVRRMMSEIDSSNHFSTRPRISVSFRSELHQFMLIIWPQSNWIKSSRIESSHIKWNHTHNYKQRTDESQREQS
jgi:hypothetical protein